MSDVPAYPVLLHGFTGSSGSWGEAVVDGLAGAGLAPALVDLPGHGRHAGERDPEAFSLEGTLEQIAGAGTWPTDLVGYSMGARLALHFAVAYPERVRRLVLESGSPGLADGGERRARRAADEELAARVRAEGVERFVDFWESLPLFRTRRALPPHALDRQHALRLANDADSLAAALTHLGTGALPSLWDRLGALDVPTLLVVGELDRKFVAIAERMAAELPDARVRVVAGAGHTVHLERPSEWLQAVVGFLAS